MEIKSIQKYPTVKPVTFSSNSNMLSQQMKEAIALEKKLGLNQTTLFNRLKSLFRLSTKKPFPEGDVAQRAYLENDMQDGINSFIKRVLSVFKNKTQTKFPIGDRGQREFLEHKP